MARAPAVRAPSRRRSRRTAVAVAASLVVVVLAGSAALAARAPGAIVVGSKNFTEQLILGEIVAQTIERETGLPVERRLNLGGTLICDRALLTGDIDVYVEYTGTALTAIFHQPPSNDPRGGDRARCASSTRAAAARCSPPLGFNNTFAILVRGADARARGLRTIDDAARVAPRVAGRLRLRVPGAAGRLSRAWRRPTACVSQPAAGDGPDAELSRARVGPGRSDRRRRHGRADQGRSISFQLEDNRRYFPPYDAVPVARAATLLRYPQVRKALEGLAGRISAADMREMNHAADAQHENPADIARRFLNR